MTYAPDLGVGRGELRFSPRERMRRAILLRRTTLRMREDRLWLIDAIHDAGSRKAALAHAGLTEADLRDVQW